MGLMAMPMIDPKGLKEVGRFTDEDGDDFAAFVNEKSGKYIIGWKASDGLAWFEVSGWIRPKEDKPLAYIETMARATLAAMEEGSK